MVRHIALALVLLSVLTQANAACADTRTQAGIPYPLAVFEEFIDAHPVHGVTGRVGMAGGENQHGVVTLTVKSFGPAPYRYQLTLSGSIQDHQRPVRKITLYMDVKSQEHIVVEPGRIVFGYTGWFGEESYWNVNLDAAGRISGVDASHIGKHLFPEAYRQVFLFMKFR